MKNKLFLIIVIAFIGFAFVVVKPNSQYVPKEGFVPNVSTDY